MKRKRTFDEIYAERNAGKAFLIKVPAIHTASGCRFSYETKVDSETYMEMKALEKKKKEEELDRWQRQKELISKSYKKFYRKKNYEKESDEERERYRKEYYKKYQEKNKERIAEYRRQYYREHREEILAANKFNYMKKKGTANESSKEKD